MSAFEIRKTRGGFAMKLWRGERMCLLGFDVEKPEEDFVGFAIECREPGGKEFVPLRNRLAFSYDPAEGEQVTGDRQFSSLAAPFQKFRWQHFPLDVLEGKYKYEAFAMYYDGAGNKLRKGPSTAVSRRELVRSIQPSAANCALRSRDRPPSARRCFRSRRKYEK